MKVRVLDITRDIDLAAIAFLALSACSQEGATRTGPVPSADVGFPSSSTPASPDGTVPTPVEAIIRLTGTVHHLDDVMTADMAGTATELLDIRKRTAD